MSGLVAGIETFGLTHGSHNLERQQQERDLVERLGTRGDYYESRFQKRETSSLRSAPSDFYRDQALYPAVTFTTCKVMVE
jgi:hypothetical protein